MWVPESVEAAAILLTDPAGSIRLGTSIGSGRRDRLGVAALSIVLQSVHTLGLLGTAGIAAT
jgi:hypothetical protein